MFKKILLNILLNLAIITLVVASVWAYNNGHYGILLGGVACIAALAFLKIRLIKSAYRLGGKKT
jgi:hypothetical protein